MCLKLAYNCLLKPLRISFSFSDIFSNLFSRGNSIMLINFSFVLIFGLDFIFFQKLTFLKICHFCLLSFSWAYFIKLFNYLVVLVNQNYSLKLWKEYFIIYLIELTEFIVHRNRLIICFITQKIKIILFI